MKQSSIEWLIEQLKLHGYLGLYTEEEYIEKHKDIFDFLIKQTKAMHKEEVINFGKIHANQMLEGKRFVTAEIIYNEIFEQ